MSEPVRWGVLGAANFALQHMARAIHAAEGAEFAAIATSSAAKAEPFRAFAPGVRVHDSYDALLADPEIDAIYIPLPNHLHVEWTQKAARAGKHVLCEKPIAMTAPEIDQLIALRDETGLVVAEAFMIVHHPQWTCVRDMLDAGEVGTLRHVDVAFSFNNPDPGNIRNRVEAGGGVLPDIGVYAFGGVRYATGQEPEAVMARWKVENEVDTFVQVWADFPGFTYGGTVSTRLAPRQEVTFQGDRGSIRMSAPFNPTVFGEARVELHRDGQQAEVRRFTSANHYVLQVEAFGRAVRGGDAYAVPLEFSRGTQAMIDQVKAAAVQM